MKSLPFFAFAALFAFTALAAQDEAEETVVEEQAAPPESEDVVIECSRETLLSFFPKPIVFKVLKKYDIPQEKWDEIYDDLSRKDRQVIKIVEQKAARMDPNPLKDLRHRAQAVRLFRETLVTTFSNVMTGHGITDQEQIEEMLDDIQIEKARAFADCMKQLQ